MHSASQACLAQASNISNRPGPAKADRPKRQGRRSRKKGWEEIGMIEVNRGDDTIITYMVGDNVYICGDESDIQKKPFSANFARPVCLVCCMEATEEDTANLVECSRCTYSVHLACNSPPLLEVPEICLLNMSTWPSDLNKCGMQLTAVLT